MDRRAGERRRGEAEGGGASAGGGGGRALLVVLRWMLHGLLVADAVLVAGLWIPLVPAWRLGAWHVGLAELDLLVLAGLGAAAAAALTDARRRRALRRLGAQAVSVLRGASWRRRAALLLSLALLLDHAAGYLDAPFHAMRVRYRRDTTPSPGLTYRTSSRHVPRLAALVARRAAPEPLVVHVIDDDPRAHQASYYAYPTLLLMAPGLRTWTTRSRQLHFEADEPAFADPTFAPVGPEPGLAHSLAYARARGLDLALADVRGARLIDRAALDAAPASDTAPPAPDATPDIALDTRAAAGAHAGGRAR